MSVQPTKKQRELLSYIDGFIAGHGYSPSFREIMRALNYNSVSTVATHINNLITRGHLRKRDNSARSLEVVAPSIKPVAAQAVKLSEEKWLIDLIDTRFKTAEENQSQPSDIDQLYVLVGALHILGLADAARAYKSRLSDLQKAL